MILGEELRRKYALTSLKAAKGCAPVAVLAINDALEIAAEIAFREGSLVIARRIRSLTWADNAAVSVLPAIQTRRTSRGRAADRAAW